MCSHHWCRLGGLYRGYSSLRHLADDAAELQHQRRYHAGYYHVCADEGGYGHEGDPTDQSHGVGAVCDLRAPVCAKGAIEIKEGRGPWLLSPRKGLFPCLRQNGMSHVVLPKLFS